jgi:hypothetical protein
VGVCTLLGRTLSGGDGEGYIFRFERDIFVSVSSTSSMKLEEWHGIEYTVGWVPAASWLLGRNLCHQCVVEQRPGFLDGCLNLSDSGQC